MAANILGIEEEAPPKAPDCAEPTLPGGIVDDKAASSGLGGTLTSVGNKLTEGAAAGSRSAGLVLGRFGKLTTKSKGDTAWTKTKQEMDEASGDVALSEDCFTAAILMCLTLASPEDDESKAVIRKAMVRKSLKKMIVICVCTLAFQMFVVLALYWEIAPETWEPADWDKLSLTWSKLISLIILGILIGKDVSDITVTYFIGVASKKNQLISKKTHHLNTTCQIIRLLTNIGCWVASFCVIRACDNVTDVWKDCVALAFIVDMDAYVFSALKAGLCGRTLMLCMNALSFEIDFGVIGNGSKLIGRYGNHKFYMAVYLSWGITMVSLVLMVLAEADPSWFLMREYIDLNATATGSGATSTRHGKR